MRFITFILFALNLTAWITFDVICWKYTGSTLGWIGLFGLITYLIAWGLSGEVVFSVMDYITQSEWDIFVSKIKWANSACIFMMGLISILSIIFDWFSLREFLNFSF